jgi:rod shape-determining protein MreC
MARTHVLRTILVWILLEAVAALQVPSHDGSVFLSWLRAVFEPVVMIAENTVELAKDLGVSARGLHRAVMENRHMKSEIEELRGRQLLLQADLDALRQIGDFAGPEGEYAVGSIVGRCAYRDLVSGIMEVRTARSILLERDTPVVAAGGLVGRVMRSEQHRHWLQLLTHAAAAVAVETEDSMVQGLALGTGGHALTVAYVPRQAKLKRGALLLTSGGDGIYPPGLPTARVIRVRESEEPFLEVTAVSTADLRSTRMVLILPKWAPKESAEVAR